MPIYDLGYRHWSGFWLPHPHRWWAITRQGIGLLIRKKLFTALMILSLIPFLVRIVMIYVSMSLGTTLPPVMQVSSAFFNSFLRQQMFFVFLIAIYAGAGLIANDLKANALQIYFSKPITRVDYFLGKAGILMFFLSLPTLIPALLLFLITVLFKADASYLTQNLWWVAPIIAYSFIIIITYSLIILGLSALTRSARFAGINFAVMILFTQILQKILSAIFRSSKLDWISINNNLSQIGAFFFRLAQSSQSMLWISGFILMALAGGSLWIVTRRLQAVEVIV
jgi:ABC-type transport system involved in multi-copper enzyme maturation permease subunit